MLCRDTASVRVDHIHGSGSLPLPPHHQLHPGPPTGYFRTLALSQPSLEYINGLASKQMYDQVSLFLVEETGQALTGAEVTVPHDGVEWSVIDTDRLPDEGPWELSDINHGDAEVSVDLGNGPLADEFLKRVDSRTKQNSERVSVRKDRILSVRPCAFLTHRDNLSRHHI